MSAKPLDIIVGQPTTESMDRMTEQMAQMVAPVKTTAWGGLHGSLALVLDDTDYAIVTRGVVTATNRVDQPPAVHPNIDDQTTQRELLRLQAETKKLQTAFELQEAVTNIGVQRIIDSVEEQYVEELNEDYFGYANQTIKSVLAHLRTKWCKVMTKERTDATDAFYHSWVPSTTHVITFGRQLTKLQKKCRTINVIISDEAKTLHFVGQMYKSDYFTEEQMTQYEMRSDVDKLWAPTLDHFSLLYANRKAYGDDRAANSGFESASAMYDVPSDRTITTTNSGDNTSRDLYIESLEESLAIAREYAKTPGANNTATLTDFERMLAEMDVQRKQFETLMKQNSDLVAALAKTVTTTTSTNRSTTASRSGRPRIRESAGMMECPNCKKMARHKPENCFNLTANADKRPTGWRVTEV
jgi:hypothetical protein